MILSLLIVGIGLLSLYTTETPKELSNAGVLGSEHSHASISLNIHGDLFDFSTPSYQVKSSWINFQENDGHTIHKHATGVTIGYLFNTLSMGIDDKCIILQDDRSFCTNNNYKLNFLVNGEEYANIRDLEIIDGNKTLIIYGESTISPES